MVVKLLSEKKLRDIILYSVFICWYMYICSV